MSGVSHDLGCKTCKTQEWSVVKCESDYLCDRCGTKRTICYDRWGGMNVDLFKVPTYNEATGREHCSTREVESEMRALGYRPKGDKVGGARPDLSMSHKAYSYGGQGSKLSTAERRAK